MTNANLFDTFDLDGLKLPNRILMSAMTRTRATEDGVPTDLMREYYVQRASSGLIVTECTRVSDQGHGIIRAPGIHRAVVPSKKTAPVSSSKAEPVGATGVDWTARRAPVAPLGTRVNARSYGGPRVVV